MPNQVVATPVFEKKVKKFLKKFPSLANELLELEEQLIEEPRMGISLGDELYKIRLASKSKGKGKRGGFRVITYLITEAEDDYEINLITIYDKSEEENISKKTLLELIKGIFDK